MALLLGVMVCLICACDGNQGDTDETIELGSTDLTYTEDHVSGELCEGVTVDADIPDLRAVKSYDVVSAHMQLPDDDALQSIKDYVFDGYSDDMIQCETPEEEQTVLYYVEGELEKYYLLNRALRITNNPVSKYIVFSNSDVFPYEHFTYDFTIPVSETSDFSSFTEQKDLTFMKRQDAVEAVKSQLNEWDIVPIGDPLLFCMDGEGMYKLLTEYYEQGLESVPVDGVSKDALEMYYMVFDIGYNNIPYTCFELGSSSLGTGAYQTRLYVMYSEKGIVYLEYFLPYAIDSTLEEHDTAITLDQAMSQVQKYYEELVVTSGIEIKNIYFQYIPTDMDEDTGKCTLLPAWIFQPGTTVTSGEEMVETYLDVIVVNAITGEIIS